MNIKIELLKSFIKDYIDCKLEDFEIDADKIADTAAIKALAKIRAAIQNESLSDFEVVEEIVTVFEKYDIDSGTRHDF